MAKGGQQNPLIGGAATPALFFSILWNFLGKIRQIFDFNHD